uniref:Gem nuclear organelle associated protein 7 n=1 Tax=Myotis myotis TaxID=51298 RepID=A0A7J7VHR4_MYOMY|nr:hypothetical protein mMyoMyo1_005586 [Myotis myotis]
MDIGHPESPVVRECQESYEQQAKAILQERYLRSLLAIVGRQVSFTSHEGVHVTTHFRATIMNVANFYVLQLQTPTSMHCSSVVTLLHTPSSYNDIIVVTFCLKPISGFQQFQISGPYRAQNSLGVLRQAPSN